MVGRLVLSLALLAAAAPVAHADSLDEARAAIEAVRYDQARPLLVAALQAGDNTPARVAEIYRLSANTATVLGDRAAAEQYYRRWLALDPTASLPASVAPKLREPFVPAQAYMAAHGRLAASASARADERGIDIAITSDPLAMVAGVSDDAGHRAKIEGPRAELPAGAKHVSLLDEFGNHLLELAVNPAPRREAEPLAPPGPRPSPSLARRPLTWAIPALVFAGAGAGFGLAARGEQNNLDDILGHSAQHTLADAESARSARDRDALIANIGFAAGGACAIAAIVTSVAYQDPPRYAVVPSGAGLGGAGLGVAGRW